MKLFNLFSRQEKKALNFYGGIRLPLEKARTQHLTIRSLPLPEQFIIPLYQDNNIVDELLVSKGDYVLKGQILTYFNNETLPMHAPTSGTITDIALHNSTHFSQEALPTLFLHPDKLDQWRPLTPRSDYKNYSTEKLSQIIHQAGITSFSAAKILHTQHIETIIINAAECEPYVTADERLIQEHADEIIKGCYILDYILKPKRILIGIEDSKISAINTLSELLAHNSKIELCTIPTKYPSGSAAQLTTLLTGKEIPSGKHSTDIGILIQNVATIFAIKKAVIDDEPLIERITTLAGKKLSRPGNVWARIGTPIDFLLEQAKLEPSFPPNYIIIGGPMKGFSLSYLNSPVTKMTNCIIAPDEHEFALPEKEQPCIRCGKCIEVCPVRLLPHQLYWFSAGKDHKKAMQYHLFDCIECGACDYVCPSNIPLVKYYQTEKLIIASIETEKARSKEAKQRYEAKQLRLEKEKKARQLRHSLAKASTSNSNIDEQAAKEVNQAVTKLVQIENKNHASHQISKDSSLSTLDTQTTQPDRSNTLNNDEYGCRKQAIEAAIARVKARKELQITQPNRPNTANHDEHDSRKQAIEAAIARVKARKESQTQLKPIPHINTDMSDLQQTEYTYKISKE